MMRRRVFLEGCLSLAAVVACSSATGTLECVDVAGPPVTPTAGAYDYVACNDAGAALVRGTVVLTVTDTVLGGAWDLRRVPGTEGSTVSPQVGTGQLVGWLNQDTVVVDLNPGIVDNNVFVSAVADAHGTIAGRWTYLTIVGPATAGPMVMKKR